MFRILASADSDGMALDGEGEAEVVGGMVWIRVWEGSQEDEAELLDVGMALTG